MSLFSRPPFQVTFIAGDDEVRLVMRGELDLSTVGTLTQAVERAEESRPRRIVFDAEKLSFIDASGFKVLLGAARRARQQDATVELVNPTPAIARILRITAIDQTIDVVHRPAPATT